MIQSERDRIVELIVKRIKGKITVVEDVELTKWGLMNEEYQALLDEMEDREKLIKSVLEYEPVNAEVSWLLIATKLGLPLDPLP